MTANEQKRLGEEGAQIAALREAIEHAFPPNPYKGKITSYDDQLVDPELDDGKFLYDAIKGRQWTEVPKELLFAQPDGYVLLTDEAFAAFLPAWLVCSLDNIDGENIVREYIVYTFSHTARQLRNLTPQQGLVVRSLLAEFALRETSEFFRNLAIQAVTYIDNLM